MKRGVVSKGDSTLLTVWVPKPLVAALDFLVNQEDTDRSKLIRSALRERIERDRCAVAPSRR
jgi:metal-responsive CopG/Arc/MetJ family transcriptional regulator